MVFIVPRNKIYFRQLCVSFIFKSLFFLFTFCSYRLFNYSLDLSVILFQNFIFHQYLFKFLELCFLYINRSCWSHRSRFLLFPRFMIAFANQPVAQPFEKTFVFLLIHNSVRSSRFDFFKPLEHFFPFTILCSSFCKRTCDANRTKAFASLLINILITSSSLSFSNPLLVSMSTNMLWRLFKIFCLSTNKHHNQLASSFLFSLSKTSFFQPFALLSTDEHFMLIVEKVLSFFPNRCPDYIVSASLFF